MLLLLLWVPSDRWDPSSSSLLFPPTQVPVFLAGCEVAKLNKSMRCAARFVPTRSLIGGVAALRVMSAPQAAFSVSGPASFAVCTLRFAGTNFGGKERGGSQQRLTQDERRKRLAGKSPDEKRAAAEALEAAERFVAEEFPDDLASLIDKKQSQAQAVLTKLTNPVLALERVEVDVNGAKRPLMQLATVLKLSAKELSVTPHDPAHITHVRRRSSTRRDTNVHAAERANGGSPSHLREPCRGSRSASDTIQTRLQLVNERSTGTAGIFHIVPASNIGAARRPRLRPANCCGSRLPRA